MDEFPSRSPLLVKYVQTHVVLLGVTSELRNPRIQPLGKGKLARSFKGPRAAGQGLQGEQSGTCPVLQIPRLIHSPDASPALVRQTEPRKGQRKRLLGQEMGQERGKEWHWHLLLS